MRQHLAVPMPNILSAILTRIKGTNPKGTDPCIFHYVCVAPRITSTWLKSTLPQSVANVGHYSWMQPLTDTLTFGPNGASTSLSGAMDAQHGRR